MPATEPSLSARRIEIIRNVPARVALGVGPALRLSPCPALGTFNS